jgi:hypothetical protein
MDETETKISQHGVVDPWAHLGPTCVALQAAHKILTDAGMDGSCHDSAGKSLYRKIFDQFVNQGIKAYGLVDGHVEGIGEGKINTVLKTSAMPWIGAKTGTVRRPRQYFDRKPVPAYMALVLLHDDGKHMLFDSQGNIVPPVNILTIETSEGPRYHAVFNSKSCSVNQRFGFLFMTEEDTTQFGVDVSMSVDVKKPDEGGFQTVMCNDMFVVQQRKPTEETPIQWRFDSTTPASVVSQSVRLRMQLVGSHGKLNQSHLVGYEGLNDVPFYYLDFLQSFFGGCEYGESVREGVIWADIKTGEVLEGDYHETNTRAMGVYTASDSMEVSVHLALGVVQYDAVTKPTEASAVPVAPALQNDEGVVVKLGQAGRVGRCFFDGSRTYYCGRHLGTRAIPGWHGQCGPTNGPACESCQRFTTEHVPSLLSCLKGDKNPYAKHILANTLKIGGRYVAICSRLQMNTNDIIGQVVPMGDTIPSESTPHTVAYNATDKKELKYSVFVYNIEDATNESLELRPTYMVQQPGTNTFQENAELTTFFLTYGECHCIPMKLFHIPDEDTDGFFLKDVQSCEEIRILFHTKHIPCPNPCKRAKH